VAREYRAIRALGCSGIAEIVDRCCACADRLVTGIGGLAGAGELAGRTVRIRRRRPADDQSDQAGLYQTFGIRPLQEAIASPYRRWYGLESARQIAATGSSGAFPLAFVAAFNVGDRVAVTRPIFGLSQHPHLAGL
jgi:hypothetical protein